MLSWIEIVNSAVNNFIWGVPAMICIIGVGLVLSFRTGFLQIRKFPYAMKVTLGRMLKKREASDGALTPFQAVCTALAATVGTGNVAGVAGAIAIGGPGAVFWMWISAILGMCTKFSEVTLAVHFREKNKDGELVGGPMYYIKNGLKKHWHWLAYLFSAFGVLTVFGTGNATQVNTITTAIDSALFNYNLISKDSVSTLNLIIGIALAALIALILLGGIKRIGQVGETGAVYGINVYRACTWCCGIEYWYDSACICFDFQGGFLAGICDRWRGRKFLYEYEKGRVTRNFLQRGRPWNRFDRTCLCRYKKAGQAGILWNL